ncbi:MAG TPA: DUF3857 domain-containing protein [Candidatus Didemnitutus sp.]|nr:DUF3857 domain-containing protein [Candidatus Didemnitutus sp.]
MIMRHLYPVRALLVAAVLGALTHAFGKTSWEPIDDADLASTECKSFPGSSAEILFQRQTLEYSSGNTWTTRSIRTKIYSAKGALDVGVTNIEYPAGRSVSELVARVVKPNHTIIELGKEDFHDSVAAKVGSYKIKRKTLAVPNLESGDILDIRWTVSEDIKENTYVWWYCQEAVPMRDFVFTVESSPSDYKILTFNEPAAQMSKTAGYKVRVEIKDQPPYVSEPDMPPERDVRGWLLISFDSFFLKWFSSDDIWHQLSSYYEEDFRLATKPGSDLKAKAAELVRGAKDDDEKLRRLYDFCQEKIDNYAYFDSASLQEFKEKDKKGEGPDPKAVLRRGAGSPDQINQLFGALARAAGFEVRLGKAGSRLETLLTNNPNGWLFMRDNVVMIGAPGAWKFFAPGDYFSPFGMMDRSNEFASALICDPDKVTFADIPPAPASASLISRTGRFTVDPDGNLEGTVQISYQGHAGASRKAKWNPTEPADIDKEYIESITKNLPAAEVTELKWENLRGRTLPLKVSYKLKVPGYADLAGSKLIVVPNVFARGEPAQFTADTREHWILFPYAWSEHDDIEVTLPEGFALDAASAPSDVGSYTTTLGSHYALGYKPKARTLTYKRDFAIGANGAVAFQKPSYPKIKQLFDGVHRSDNHSIVFKYLAPVSQPAPVPPPATPSAPAASGAPASPEGK